MGGLSLISCTLIMNSDGGSRGRLEARSTAWANSTYCAFSSRSRLLVTWILPVASSITNTVAAPSPVSGSLVWPWSLSILTFLINLLLFSTGGLDLIFVPGLGFDKQSNRLGRGKGYYDAYLKRCLQSQDVKPYTLALVFKEQICLQVPVDENDVKVD